MTVRPTIRALNRPLLIAGLERKTLGVLFLISVLIAAQGDSWITRIIAGVLFVIGFGFAKRATRRDSRMFEIAPKIWRQKSAYDAFKREAFHFELVRVREEE